jgi:hypothetical protein
MMFGVGFYDLWVWFSGVEGCNWVVCNNESQKAHQTFVQFLLPPMWLTPHAQITSLH